jgi:hypothetical protein
MNKNILGKYGFHYADGWLHYEMKSGSGSIRMPQSALRIFLAFLQEVLNALTDFNNSVMPSTSWSHFEFQSDCIDGKDVYIFIRTETSIVIFLFEKKDLKDIIKYLKEKA